MPLMGSYTSTGTLLTCLYSKHFKSQSYESWRRKSSPLTNRHTDVSRDGDDCKDGDWSLGEAICFLKEHGGPRTTTFQSLKLLVLMERADRAPTMGDTPVFIDHRTYHSTAQERMQRPTGFAPNMLPSYTYLICQDMIHIPLFTALRRVY